MSIKKQNYYHQPKRIAAMYPNKKHKRFLEGAYTLYRGGEYGDMKSSERYKTVEEMFLLEPFIFQRIKKDFEPALAALIDMLVIDKRINSDIDYSSIALEDIENRILSHIDSIEHMNAFDRHLHRYLQRQDLLSDYFTEDGQARLCLFPRLEVGTDVSFKEFSEASGSFRTHDSLMMFYKFDLDTFFANPQEEQDGPVFKESREQFLQANSRALRNVFENYSQKVTSLSQYHQEFPYLTSLMGRENISDRIVETYQLTAFETGQIDAFIETLKKLNIYNAASLCHTSGLMALYEFFKKHKSVVESRLEKEGLLDQDTDALYFVRFSGMAENHIKVGVGNYNNIWTRMKILRNECSKQKFFDTEEERQAFIEENLRIEHLDVIYLPQAHRYEKSFKDTFARADISYLTPSSHGATEFICLDVFKDDETNESERSAEAVFQEMLATVKKISKTSGTPKPALVQDPLGIIPHHCAYAKKIRPMPHVELPAFLRGAMVDDGRQMDLFEG